MGAVAGFLGDILIISPPSVSLANPYVLTDSGDHKTFNNPVGSPAQRYWDDASPVTVQTTINGGTLWTTQPASAYTIRYVTGQVVLNAPLTGTAGCQLIVGKYFPWARVGNTTSWEAQPAVKSVDVTTHKGVGGSPFNDYALTTMGEKFLLKKWWIDETLITILLARARYILSCLDPVGGRYEAYGWFTDNGISIPVASIASETATFLASGLIYFV